MAVYRRKGQGKLSRSQAVWDGMMAGTTGKNWRERGNPVRHKTGEKSPKVTFWSIDYKIRLFTSGSLWLSIQIVAPVLKHGFIWCQYFLFHVKCFITREQDVGQLDTGACSPLSSSVVHSSSWGWSRENNTIDSTRCVAVQFENGPFTILTL